MSFVKCRQRKFHTERESMSQYRGDAGHDQTPHRDHGWHLCPDPAKWSHRPFSRPGKAGVGSHDGLESRAAGVAGGDPRGLRIPPCSLNCPCTDLCRAVLRAMTSRNRARRGEVVVSKVSPGQHAASTRAVWTQASDLMACCWTPSQPNAQHPSVGLLRP